MRYLELLIDRARELSQNTRYDSDSGISQKTFTQFFQNAQNFMTLMIVNSKSKYFIEPVVIPVVSNQEEYSYPSDIILQGIDTIEWSNDQRSWIPLEKNIQKDRTINQSGYPFGYILNRRNYVLSPPVTSGYLRISYNQKPKRLEKRSAKVVSTTGTPITSITIDGSFLGTDMAYLNQFKYITICDSSGNPKVSAIPITGASGTSITVANYTLGSGETIVAGDFVLADQSTTNIPDLDDAIETFLVLHSTYQAKYGDSSQWSAETKKDVVDHANEIIKAFGTLSEDISQIPITNLDFLSMW